MCLCFAVIQIGTNGTYREEVYNFTPSLPTMIGSVENNKVKIRMYASMQR